MHGPDKPNKRKRSETSSASTPSDPFKPPGSFPRELSAGGVLPNGVLPMNKRPCFLYVNAAAYKGKMVAKVGYSYTPYKRMREFNTGLRCLNRKGLLDEKVQFSRFFSIKLLSVDRCKKIERAFFDSSKPIIIKQFGVEVVDGNPESAAFRLCGLMEGL